jgi:hypothetical protein
LRGDPQQTRSIAKMVSTRKVRLLLKNGLA